MNEQLNPDGQWNENLIGSTATVNNVKHRRTKSDVVKVIQTNIDSVVKNEKKLSEESIDLQVQFVERHYVERNSLLTDMIGYKHIITIYNIFTTLTIYCIFHTVCANFSKHGEVNFNLQKLAQRFAKLGVAFTIWLPSFLLTLLVHPCFKLWMKLYDPTAISKPTLNSCFVALFQNYLLFLICYSAYQMINHDVSIVTSIVLTAEIIRMSLKSYAFLRTNANCVVTNKEFKVQPLPIFSNYLYFLFAPTLIYRDSYPRNDKINWLKVGQYLIEFIFAVYSFFFISDHYLEGNFNVFATTEIEFTTFLTIILKITTSLTVLHLYGFFILQHVWLNMVAEILRFSDRIFYTDWWNSKSLTEYLCKWNTPVCDWFYEYIYKDFYVLSNKSTVIASSGTIIILAIIHEYIIGFAFGFFVPFSLVVLGIIECVLMFVKQNQYFGNLIFWLSHILGYSLCFCLYRIEHCARANIFVDPNNPPFKYFFTPQLFSKFS